MEEQSPPGKRFGALRRMVSGVRNWRRTEAGQSLVEFSLVLPIFLVLVFSLVDFGRAFYTWMIITNAAREGARAGAVQLDENGINQKLYASFCSNYPSSCALDTSRMSVTKTNVQGSRGTEVSVDISYDFDYVTPLGSVLQLLGGSDVSPLVIKSHSSMRLE